MDSLTDLIYQTMFATTPKGYNPREVDQLMEKLKDECRIWSEKYQQLEQEVIRLRELNAEKRG